MPRAARSVCSAARASGKTVLIHGTDLQHREGARRPTRSSPASASAPARATTCTAKCSESGVLNKTALVYGQMNEPPGARMRVALSGLTMAEYFRDRQASGRAAVHRQHLPLHPGGFRGLGAAGPYALLPLATSQHWPPKWAPCRNASHPPARAPSRPYRPSTCPLTT